MSKHALSILFFRFVLYIRYFFICLIDFSFWLIDFIFYVLNVDRDSGTTIQAANTFRSLRLMRFLSMIRVYI